MPIEHGPKPEEQEISEGRFLVGIESIASDEHPDRNEDAPLVKPRDGLFGVFDGMSRPPGGERASTVARESISLELHGLPFTLAESDAEHAVRQALDRAQAAVLEEQQRGYRVGTTASVVLVRRNEQGQLYAAIGNAADSRIWIWHTKSTLEQITTDDISAATPDRERDELHALQQRLNEVATPDQLNQLGPLDYSMFRDRHQISHSIGSSEFDPVVFTRHLESSDAIVITSDGIHDNLTATEIINILKADQDPNITTSTLVRAAQERSRDENHPRAKPDDMTAIVVEYKP